ncbi:MAG: endolytic transglycosylase MltG, partial [Solirubrobacteraceae bacterium]
PPAGTPPPAATPSPAVPELPSSAHPAEDEPDSEALGVGYATGGAEASSADPQPVTGDHELATGETDGYDFETGEHEFEAGEHEFEAGEHEFEAGEHEFEAGDHEFEAGDHEFESPVGTRRVSHRETLAARGDQTTRAQRPRRPRRARGRAEGGRTSHSWLGRIVSLIALAVAAALIWFLIQLFQPFQGSAHGRVTVVVPAKATSSQIGDLLARDGVISSSLFFELRATLAGERSSLRSGVYHLQLGMSYGDVLTALTKAPPAAKVTALTITEGRTRQYINARLKSQHLGNGYLADTRHSALIDPRQYGLRHAPPTLEGFLFPDTYQLIDPVKVSALVTDQLKTFKQNFATVNLKYAQGKHLTAYDVLTIASLIEAEAASARDRPLVASVVYNRLAAGMELQFDSTTRYATGNYTQPITVSQLHSPSPWNTHTHLGLPPTPIDSPGLAAINAAAHPARTNYLFFFARRCGRGTAFAATYSRFLNLAAQDARRPCGR